MKINYKCKKIKMKNFQVGEYVTCIEGEGPENGGAGWQKDLTFIITEIGNYKPTKCYFGGNKGNGVYEGNLRQAYPEEIQKL